MATFGIKRDRPQYWRLYRRAFGWVWSAARREFLVTLMAQLVAAGALAVGLLCGRAIVQGLTVTEASAPLGSFLPAIVGLAVSLVVSGLCLVVTREARLLIGELAARRQQAEIVEIAGSVDYEQFERQEFHDLLGRANGYGSQSSVQIVYDILNVVNAIATSVAMVAVVATSVPQILPALAIIAIPFLLAARVSARLAFRTLYDLTPQDRLRFYLYGALTGKREAKELRVFDLHAALQDRWSALYDGRIERMRGLVTKRALLNGLATIAGAGLVAGVVIVIVRAAINDQVSLGNAAVAVVALQQLASRVRTASSSAGSLRQAALFLDDFARFQSLRQDRSEEPHPPALVPMSVLRVENVSFRYPGTERPVLDDVSIKICRGEIVAMVGVSGSGKTTLAHLVAGLYKPTEGRITWDGQDVSSLPRRSYWRSLAVVYQDFARYELTARENITLSDHTRLTDLAAAEEAAQRAGIASAIEHLPAGYESMLSRAYDGGADLSAGQWQRMAVARAFFRDASLLILDEPAAALDPIAEQQLYERVEELCSSRSVLLISHRFSTVRLADRIYVMQEGRIVEHGTHSELLELDGHYAQLFRAQAAGYVQTL